MNVQEGKFANFENSYKINKNKYDDNFFRIDNQKKKEIYISGKKNGDSGTLSSQCEQLAAITEHQFTLSFP